MQRRAAVKVAEALDSIGVDYLITGSVAAGFYSVPRMTRDLDVIIDPNPGDRAYLQKVLSEDFTVDPDAVREAMLDRTIFNAMTEETKIDFIVRNPRMNPGPIFDRHREVLVDGVRLKLLAPEDLIIAKLLWARLSYSEQQMRDVHNLLHYQGLDLEYVRRLVVRHRLGELFREAQGERYAT
ncbi:MAG: nucleotidyltransferase [Chloroflexi bacterium]|nr:nucleotidyltransferase [Chloroflexota bacterium]